MAGAKELSKPSESLAIFPQNLLDPIDTQILEMLRRNGRATLTELGRATGISKTAVKYRLDRLVKSGIIQGFFALVDSKSYGRNLSVVFDLMVEPSKVEEVAKAVASFNEVIRTYELTNSPELHVHALFSDQAEMEHFLKEKLYTIKGISSIKTGIIMKRYKMDVTLTV